MSLFARPRSSHLPLAIRSVLLGLAALHAMPALAQPAEDSAVELDAVQVQAPIATRSGTATKTGTPIAEIPQSVSVITDRQMQDRAVHGVEEALWFTAGAQGGQYGDDSRSDWMIVRGFEPARYLDGLAVVSGTWTGDSRIEPYGLERIDVLKGPSSVNYGAMPPGGLVNYVSKRPTEQSLHEVELQVGSENLLQAGFDLGGKLNDSGTWLYRLTGMARNSDSVIDQVHDDRYFLAPAVTWRPDQSTRLTILARWQKAETVEAGGFLPLEGTLEPGADGRRISPSFFAGEPGANDFDKDSQSLGYEFEHDFAAGSSFHQSARYMSSEVDASNANFGLFGLQDDFIPGSDPGRTLLTRYYYPRLEKSKSFALDNNLQFKFRTGRAEHTLLAGLDYRRSRDDYASAFAFGAPPIDAYNPVYGADYQVPDFTAHTLQVQTQTGLYLQDQIKLDRWVFTLGGRQDAVNTRTEDKLNGGSSDQSDQEFSGRVGINYLFDNGITPYIGYSQSFQPTIGTAFDGQAFVPTTGEQTEVGIKYQPAGGRLLATLAAYEITQQNTLTVDPDNALYSVQQGETRVRGVELEGRWNLGSGLSIHGAYTYTDSEVTESTAVDTIGKEIALQPGSQGSLGADYTITQGVLAGLGFGGAVRYTGSQYGDIYNVFETGSYTVFDASVHYDVAAWRFQLNANNVTDKEYVAVCNSAAWCYYGYPRTVTATARFQW
ncbi:TonB-dependent siderophore receptor [Pseudoxanthomonas dokdonensis]|uniref:TonB-dependent receptor n=1 Tax=Pseudoxanthomonas dokdonensis TaxID=344882 RepID=A0A0R0CXP5_9GAMM|nr:TonB-dependent siderophore receptor [Pseudoxanthomonas dokdonensis]KRG70903.1 TonB-dependent receptor [Pseudoxanthomonas dokdonensis]